MTEFTYLNHYYREKCLALEEENEKLKKEVQLFNLMLDRLEEISAEKTCSGEGIIEMEATHAAIY